MITKLMFQTCVSLGLAVCIAVIGCAPKNQNSPENTAQTESSEDSSEPLPNQGDDRFVGNSELPLNQKAILAFEIRVDEIMNSDLVEGLISDEMLEVHGLLQRRDIKNIQTVRRLTGCFSDLDLSKGPATFYGTTSKQDAAAIDKKINRQSAEKTLPTLPEFWLEIEFADEHFVRDEILSEFEDDEQVVLLGKSFYQNVEMKALKVLALPIDGRTIQFGTQNYFEHRAANAVTQKVGQLWKRTPSDAPLRVVVDGNGAIKSLSGLADFFSKHSPDFAKEYVDLLRLRADVILTFDPSDQELFGLEVDAGSQGGAKKVLTSLRKFHVLMEADASPLINAWKKDFPEDADVVKQLVESARPTVADSKVSVVLKKPQGFEKSFRNALARGRHNMNRHSEMRRLLSIGIAMKEYRDSSPGHRYPFGSNRPGIHDDLSWRVAIMSRGIFKKIRVQHDITKAWDDPANRLLLRSMPRDFGTGGANTKIMHVRRPTNTVNENAIMLIESKDSFPWSKPVDIEVEQAIKLVQSLKPNESLLVMKYDYSVQYLQNSFSEDDLRKLFSANVTSLELQRIFSKD